MTSRLDLMKSTMSTAFRHLLRRAVWVVPALIMAVLGINSVAPAYASTQIVQTTNGPSQVAVQAPAAQNALLAVGAMPAAEDTPGGGGGGGGQRGCDNGGPGLDETQNLAVSRWGDGASKMHARLSADAWDDVTQKFSRYGIDTTFLGFGNTAFSSGANWVQMADRFCAADTLGAKFDVMGGKLAQQIWNSPLMTLLALFVIGYFAYIGYTRRGNPDWKFIGRSMLIMGLFFTMAFQATKSDPESGDVAKMSPGWIISSINEITQSSTSVISGSMLSSQAMEGAVTEVADPNGYQDKNTGSCLNFVKQMNKMYVDENGGDFKNLGPGTVPMQMDQMWQMTGLPAYVNTQFGKNNNYGYQGFCWFLDRTSGVPTSATTDVAWNYMGIPVPDLDDKAVNKSPMWKQSGITNTEADMVGIFGGMCQYKGGSWKVSPGFKQVDNTGDANESAKGEKLGKPSDKQCQTMWDGSIKKTYNKAWSDLSWNFQDGDDKTNRATDKVSTNNINKGWNPGDFVNAFHGNSGASDSMSALVFMVTAIIMMIVFGGLALVVFIMKLLLVAMGIIFFFVLLAALIPGRSESTLGSFFKQLIGFSLVAFGYSLLLSMVMAITSIVVSSGTMLGLSGLGLVLWTGFAPILSLVMFAWMWKRFMRGTPNPLSPKGMMSYAKSSGSLGAAAVGGFAGAASKSRDFATGRGGHGGHSMGRKPAMAGAGAGGAGVGAPGNPNNKRAGGMNDGLGSDAESASKGAPSPATGAATGALLNRMSGKTDKEARTAGRGEFHNAVLGDKAKTGTGRRTRRINDKLAARELAKQRLANAHGVGATASAAKDVVATSALGNAVGKTAKWGAIGAAGATAGMVAAPTLGAAALAAGGAAGAAAAVGKIRGRKNRAAERAAQHAQDLEFFQAAQRDRKGAVAPTVGGGEPAANGPATGNGQGQDPAQAAGDQAPAQDIQPGEEQPDRQPVSDSAPNRAPLSDNASRDVQQPVVSDGSTATTAPTSGQNQVQDPFVDSGSNDDVPPPSDEDMPLSEEEVAKATAQDKPVELPGSTGNDSLEDLYGDGSLPDWSQQPEPTKAEAPAPQQKAEPVKEQPQQTAPKAPKTAPKAGTGHTGGDAYKPTMRPDN